MTYALLKMAREELEHPLARLLETYLAESEDNTWDKVVDHTVTHGTNGLRMPYCDKAQRRKPLRHYV